jgi:hypothetical protein
VRKSSVASSHQHVRARSWEECHEEVSSGIGRLGCRGLFEEREMKGMLSDEETEWDVVMSLSGQKNPDPAVFLLTLRFHNRNLRPIIPSRVPPLFRSAGFM